MQLEKNSRCKLRGKKLLEKYFHPPTGIKKIVINLKKMVLIITIMVHKNNKSVFQFEIRLQVHRDMLKEVPYPAKGSS